MSILKSAVPLYCRGLISGMLVILGLSGCTSAHYRNSADQATYGAIKQKSPLVKDMDPNFSIEQTNSLELCSLPVFTNEVDYLGLDGAKECGARILRLDDALKIAVNHSRSYQSHKESLYLSALALTLARHEFTPLFSAGAKGAYSGEAVDSPALSDNFVEERKVSAGGSFSAEWLIRDLGRITTAFTTDFLRFVSGDPRLATSSKLSATFVRPLLRDAGFKQDMENLTQAERDLLYELRAFTQFRKDFSVKIAAAYYDVLSNRDAVRNSYLTLKSSRKNADRTRALSQEGRVAGTDLGRQEQQELSSESTWINAVRSYKQALDDFKILIGLKVDTHLVLDERELTSLQIHHPNISADDSTRLALAARLDFMNIRDQLEDAERQVLLAQDGLRADVKLTADASIASGQKEHFSMPDARRYSWSAGLDVDPGLDRTAARNSYRAALIARNKAARTLEEQEDQIKLDVRESWRTLDQAKRNFEISEIGVRLAERRVEEQGLLSEWGRSKAQDQVDAQNALNSSKDQRTKALVTHTMARLQFWNNMGILYIRDNGKWKDLQDAEAR
jgi:outer membrane protein TolC